jgi:hypothetical protein
MGEKSNESQPLLTSDKRLRRGAKYYIPLILVTFSAGMLFDGLLSRRLLVVCPILLVALFFLSLATVDCRSGVLRYRRFLKWISIDEREILGCGVSWPGVIGYLRLRHYVIPWKRLYFVLDVPPGQNPFTRRGSALLAYVRSRTDKRHQDSPQFETVAHTASAVSTLVAGLAGAISYCLAHVFLPALKKTSVLEQSPSRGNPAASVFFTVQRGIAQVVAHSFELTLVFFAVFILAAVYQRRQPSAWLYALLAGATFAAAMFHLL